MNIYDMILAALQTKFEGVDASILSRIATKKAEGVMDAGEVNSIVEGIGFADILNYYGDFRAKKAQITAVANYEKKHGLKNGKPTEIENPEEEDQQKPVKEEDAIPAWAQTLIDSNKSLSVKLAEMEAAKAQATRAEQVLAKAKEYGIPANYAKRCAIKDDEDLDAYFKDLSQEFANDGFKGVVPPVSAEQKEIQNSNDIAALINKGTEELNKN